MSQAAFREVTQSFREMKEFLTKACARKVLWITMAIVLAVFTLVGPFGTFDKLAIWERFLFFTITILGSWALSMISIALVMGTFNRKFEAPLIAIVIGSVLGAVFVALWLDLSIRWFFELPASMSAWSQFPYALILCVGSGVIAHFAFRKSEAEASSNNKELNALMARLTLEVRAEPSYLTMQDHYVEVTTPRGRQLVHMKMGEAVLAMAEYDGIQIHRSHWINLKHVEKATKIDGKLTVTMNDGTQFPVSRTYSKAAKAAGIF